MCREAILQLELPVGEAEAFCESLGEALRLAHSGKILLGYDALIQAQQRALKRCGTRALRMDLMECYGDALSDYREVFGVPLN
jgi:hypothetical protein